MSKEQNMNGLAESEVVKKGAQNSFWLDEFPQKLDEPPEVPCKHLRMWDPHEIRKRLWAALLAQTNINDQESYDGVDGGVVETNSN